MQLPIFQVDAFTDKVFGGNPAAVCLLVYWLSDDVMQRIAMENSVADTAFFIPLDDGFEIRWFTPEIEMDLCGHATLATAHVIARHLIYSLPSILIVALQTWPWRFTILVFACIFLLYPPGICSVCFIEIADCRAIKIKKRKWQKNTPNGWGTDC